MLTKESQPESSDTEQDMGKTVKKYLMFHNSFENVSKRQKISDDLEEMEKNESSAEDLVFTQPLSHEQLQNNREVLARRLLLRRPREELVNQGIMPAVSAAPIILQQKSRLERAQTSDILQKKIRVRPDRNQLIQRHILQDSNADPSIQARQISLKRKKLQDDLNERLLMRPGPLELVNKNILDPGSMVGHAIKEGAVEYSDTKDSALIVNALSPPESFNDESPQPSPGTCSIGSPPELPPSPAFPTPLKVDLSGESQFKAFSHIQSTVASVGPSKLKDIKGRKKNSKAKFKKYKYHEYRPPNTETSCSSKTDTSSLPPDSPYALLLQQQQLYLQLQVLCQNYPQTFLPLLPAVQKSSPVDNTPVEKPMKLEDMRVIDLRNELKNRGLPVSGSKNNLMERLKLANANQGSNSSTVTSTATSVTQSSTPVPVAPRTTLSRSTSAPGGVALVNSIRPGKILNDAEKILQMEQNISVEEIQQKIQQLQYLNLQLQLQQLDLKKSQQGKPLQPKSTQAEASSQQMTSLLSNRQPLQHHSTLAQPCLSQQQPQQAQQSHQQQVQLQQQQQNKVQQQQTVQQQQQLEQHLHQLKQMQQLQQPQLSVDQQQEQNQQLQQHLQQQQQQYQQQKKLKSQQRFRQQQPQHQGNQQQRLYNQLSVSQASSVSQQGNSESTNSQIPTSSIPTISVASLPPPQQCQVSISATPLLHCSALTCNKNCNHVQLSSTSNSLPNILNSVQQHNVIHFKQPVKPVIILQPSKPQQRAELLFSPTEQQQQQPITADVGNDSFFQQVNKNEAMSSLHRDMEHDHNWQGIMEPDTRSPSNSPTSLERSPPPYFEAVAGRLSPRSASFSTSSLNNNAGLVKTHQRTNSCGSTSPLAHRRSLSVPSVNRGSVQQPPQELQKGHKSVSMCLEFPEADEMSHIADNYHGITQELQKAMIIESQNNLDHRNAELLEILGDTLFPTTTAAGSVLSSSNPNFPAFLAGGKNFTSSSPKAPRSPTTNLPSYQEAIQNSLCVQSPPPGTTFNTNELLNGYHERSSPVNITQHPEQRKISSSNLEDSLTPSPGSPMRVDTDDMDLLQRTVLDANNYQRDSFGDFRTPDVRGNSLYHVNPSDIFGNPQMTSSDARLIKQEDSGLPFLDMDVAAAEFAESMDFTMTGDSGISMSAVPFSQ